MQDVTRGLHGSMLGPVLFNILVNHPGLGVNSELAKFADDTQLFKVEKTECDCEEPQRDLCTLEELTHYGISASSD